MFCPEASEVPSATRTFAAGRKVHGPRLRFRAARARKKSSNETRRLVHCMSRERMARSNRDELRRAKRGCGKNFSPPARARQLNGFFQSCFERPRKETKETRQKAIDSRLCGDFSWSSRVILLRCLPCSEQSAPASDRTTATSARLAWPHNKRRRCP